jgi:hypothetical protein
MVSTNGKKVVMMRACCRTLGEMAGRGEASDNPVARPFISGFPDAVKRTVRWRPGARYATRVCNPRVRHASMGPSSARNTLLGSEHAPHARAESGEMREAEDARGMR